MKGDRKMITGGTKHERQENREGNNRSRDKPGLELQVSVEEMIRPKKGSTKKENKDYSLPKLQTQESCNC